MDMQTSLSVMDEMIKNLTKDSLGKMIVLQALKDYLNSPEHEPMLNLDNWIGQRFREMKEELKKEY